MIVRIMHSFLQQSDCGWLQAVSSCHKNHKIYSHPQPSKVAGISLCKCFQKTSCRSNCHSF